MKKEIAVWVAINEGTTNYPMVFATEALAKSWIERFAAATRGWKVIERRVRTTSDDM